MSEITAIVPRSFDEVVSLSKTISGSELLPQALRGKPANVAITIMAGAELGIGPMQALRGIEVIGGKATLKPELLAAMVMRRADICEYLRIVERDNHRCTYETKRRGHPEPTRITFTIEDAKKMGLAGKDTYQKQPADMLDARCLSRICRKVYPDLCFNFYVEGEIAEEPADPKAAHAAGVADAIKAQVKPVEVVDAEVVVEPVDRVGPMRARIQASGSVADLEALKQELSALNKPEKQALANDYVIRRAKLERGEV